MGTLAEILREEVSWYAAQGTGVKLRLFKSLDDLNQTYAVTAVRDPNPQQEPPRIVVLARIVGDQIIIEADNTDRPLYRHLIEVGIPREQITLAYAGEARPESAV